MPLRTYRDTIALALPLRMAQVLDDDIGQAAIIQRVSTMATEVLRRDYPAAKVLAIEWTFCLTDAEVAAWPLPHDCDECREAKTRSYEVLAGGKQFVALGCLHLFGPVPDEEPT